MTIGEKKKAIQLLEKNVKRFKDDYHKACVAIVKKREGKDAVLSAEDVIR